MDLLTLALARKYADQGSGNVALRRGSRAEGINTFAGQDEDYYTPLYLFAYGRGGNLVLSDGQANPYEILESCIPGDRVYCEIEYSWVVDGGTEDFDAVDGWARFESYEMGAETKIKLNDLPRPPDEEGREYTLHSAVIYFSDLFGAHSEGFFTLAGGIGAHAEGYRTVAAHQFSHIMGKHGVTKNAYSWHLANGSEYSPGLAAKILSTGQAHATAWNTGGADYAEAFEWLDGNANAEDRVGYFVTLNGDKIRKATSSDTYILGITGANPGVLGDAQGLNWHGRYLRDEWDRIKYHEVGVGKHKTIEPQINPDWNPEEPYVERLQRPEWAAVGMMGKLLVRDDGTCQVNGYCKSNDDGIATTSTTGYRVMKRVSNNIIQVLVK